MPRSVVALSIRIAEEGLGRLLAAYAGVLLFAGVADLRHACFPRHVALVAGGFAAVFALAVALGT